MTERAAPTFRLLAPGSKDGLACAVTVYVATRAADPRYSACWQVALTDGGKLLQFAGESPGAGVEARGWAMNENLAAATALEAAASAVGEWRGLDWPQRGCCQDAAAKALSLAQTLRSDA